MFCYQVAVFLGLSLLAGNFLLNLCFFRKPRPATADPADSPLVSVLVPARDEVLRIGPCLESLFRQDYPHLEFLVLDDHSTDGTAALVASSQKKEPRLRLLHGAELPAGWTGKAWACEQLSREARGEYLLFTDADTRHEFGCVSAAVQMLRTRRADMISLWPRQITVTWGEKLVLPFVHVLLLFFLPHWMPGRFSSLGAANGQFLLFRREAYVGVGGHAAVQGQIVEDVALARMVKKSGMKLVNGDGSELVACRMYESLHQIWEGFSKNLRAGSGSSPFGFLLLLLLQVVCLLGPFLIWPAALWTQGGRATVLIAWQAGVIILLRLILALRCRQSIASVFLHPLGQGLVILIALNSWRQFAAGRLSWKGRVYRP